MARKPKVIEASDTYDDSHDYRCLSCGKVYDNPVGKFFRSQYSQMYVKNSKYVPVCQECVNEMFRSYENRFGTHMACVIMCHKLDVPFYYSLYDSILKNNSGRSFSIGLYLRQMNQRQYKSQDFSTTLLGDELGKTPKQYELEKEVKWNTQDLMNRDFAIEVITYDPFEEYPEEDRKFLFGQLAPYLDDDTYVEDRYKLNQLLQILDNENQIHICNKRIRQLDPVRDVEEIKQLNSIKSTLVTSNDKIAKENEISVKNRSDKSAGRSTLSFLMRDLRERDFDRAEADYYDQLRSAGTRWAADVSQKSIMDHCVFDESDKKEIFEKQYELIAQKDAELDDKKEQVRLLLDKVNKLTAQVKSLGGKI